VRTHAPTYRGRAGSACGVRAAPLSLGTPAETGHAVTKPNAVTITEKAWMGQVVELASVLGWEHYHPWLSIHSARGWPDLALVRPPRLVLAELKAEKGKVTPAQNRWLGLLGRCNGVEVYLWRPSDLDYVVKVLRSQ
jgi:hypothetical protein